MTITEEAKQNMKEKQIFNITQLSGIYNIIIKNCGIIIVYCTGKARQASGRIYGTYSIEGIQGNV